MVLFVLVAYTAIGGLLFRMWEGWAYFDAFYFCFITMATVGKCLEIETAKYKFLISVSNPIRTIFSFKFFQHIIFLMKCFDFAKIFALILFEYLL